MFLTKLSEILVKNRAIKENKTCVFLYNLAEDHSFLKIKELHIQILSETSLELKINNSYFLSYLITTVETIIYYNHTYQVDYVSVNNINFVVNEFIYYNLAEFILSEINKNKLKSQENGHDLELVIVLSFKDNYFMEELLFNEVGFY